MNGNWTFFAPGPSDRYEAPIRVNRNQSDEDGAALNHHHKHGNVHRNPRQQENNCDGVANESTLLLANKDQPKPSQAAASVSVLTPQASPQSPRFRISRSSRPTTPSSSSQQSLLLHSMRYWEVALPPVKKHVVGGKLVETFQASLYGNDKTRSLPAAKRRLTIEVYGREGGTRGWGRRRRQRSFLDPDESIGGVSSSTSSSTGNRGSTGNHDSWDLFSGVVTSDLARTGAGNGSNGDGGGISDVEKARVATSSSGTNTEYELDERDIVILRVMKPRLVNEYDDEYGFGFTSIAGGLHDRKWESQSMSDRTMSGMVGLDVNDNDDCEESGSCNNSNNDDDNNSIISDITTMTKKRHSRKKNVQWIELSRTRVSQIEMVRIDFEANEVDLKMGVGPRTVVQTFHFGDEYGSLDGRRTRKGNDARTFARIFELLKRLQSQRARRLADLHRGLLSLPELEHKPDLGIAGEPRIANDHSETEQSQTEAVSILVEIVSASNLPSPGGRTTDSLGGMAITGNDFFVPAPEVPPTSDPYVVVRDGKTDVHSTSIISDTLNPIWTLSTGSLCLLQYNSLLDFFERSNVLEFALKNHEPVVGLEHETIGAVMVHKTELLEGNGERHCYPILLPSQSVNRKNSLVSLDSIAFEPKTTPSLYLRCRRASPEDIDFMTTLQERKTKDCSDGGVYASDAFLAPSTQSAQPPSFLERSTRTNKATGHLECRIKPGPDPKNVPQTSWMPPSAIETVSRDHSRAWTLAGSGSIAQVFLEILGCDGLLNLARTPGDKIDPFVCVVYEDSVLNTDVIYDCRSPRWMPWSQRAFVLNMMHPCSQVFLGVLDRNRGSSFVEAKHNPLGRAVINLSNLRPGAIYTLTFQLFDTDGLDRQANGTITIRLRIKMEDERKALLSELNLKDHFYVSTVEGSDFRSALYSLTNDSSHPSLSLRNLENYSNELVAYLNAWDVIADALIVVLLWRGHYPVTLSSGSFPSCFCGRRPEISLRLPLHSMVAFAWATVLAWDFEKLFSFFFFAIGWALLATLEDQRRSPSSWRRPRSYCEFLGILVFNKSSPNPRRTIHAYEKLEQIQRFESDIAERASTKKETLERLKRDRQKQQHHWKEEVERPPDDITTEGEQEGSSELILAPFKSVLLPIQKLLYKLCVVLRIATSVALWRDSYAAFWIVTMCFLGSFIASWIPWAFLIKWGFTIFVWTLFGPWMKLVDIYYVRPKQNLTPKGRAAKLEVDYKQRYNLLLWSEWNSNRIYRENAMKMKDMKRYMFGKYLMRVPILKEERFPSVPAISSSSVPYNAHPRPVNVVRRIHGQRLWGDMVPYRAYNRAENEVCEEEVQSDAR